jgi:hypothetical protein
MRVTSQASETLPDELILLELKKKERKGRKKRTQIV